MIKTSPHQPDESDPRRAFSSTGAARQFPWMGFVIVTCIASVMCFYRLGSRAMWQDEGETAVLAQSVLIHGIPKAKIGDNVVQQDAKAFDESYTWTFHPWGQFYLAAIGLKAFGENAMGARAPFALCGVLCVAMLFLMAWRTTRCTRTAVVCALLLAISATFVTHARQCRYYALDALTCLVVVGVLLELLRRPDWKRGAAFGVALAAQFYTNFGLQAALLPGLVVVALFFQIRMTHLRAVSLGLLVAVVLCIPGGLVHGRRLWGGGATVSPLPFLTKAIAHLSYIDGWFAPLAVLLIAGAIVLLRRFRTGRVITVDVCLAIGCAFTVILAAIIMAYAAPIPHVRYLIALMPLAKLALGICAVGLYRITLEKTNRPAMAWTALFVCIAILVTSNVAAVPIQWIVELPDQQTPDFCTSRRPYLRFDAAGMLHELTHDFPCFDQARLEAVNRLARRGDMVLTNYGDLPLMFHRPDVLIRGGVGGGERPVEDGKRPDLILIQSAFGIPFQPYLDQLRESGDYVEQRVSVPNSPYGNIPEPRAHLFAAPEQRLVLWIFVKKKNADRVEATTRPA
ncbi:MAG: glycosyltransferase family 39 protein [Planctomycetota bacterium]